MIHIYGTDEIKINNLINYLVFKLDCAREQEDGFTARIMHYARFPSTRERLSEQAKELANLLAEELCQLSYSIESDMFSTYYQREGFTK